MVIALEPKVAITAPMFSRRITAENMRSSFTTVKNQTLNVRVCIKINVVVFTAPNGRRGSDPAVAGCLKPLIQESKRNRTMPPPG